MARRLDEARHLLLTLFDETNREAFQGKVPHFSVEVVRLPTATPRAYTASGERRIVFESRYARDGSRAQLKESMLHELTHAWMRTQHPEVRASHGKDMWRTFNRRKKPRVVRLQSYPNKVGLRYRLGIPLQAISRLGWQKGDPIEVIHDEAENILVLRRVAR
jgi:hypothetical protein